MATNSQKNAQAHTHWLRQLAYGNELLDIEHYRFPEYSTNVAVVVLRSGHAYIGRSQRNGKDQPDKSLGYRIAVGRALKSAATDQKANFIVPDGKTGVALRDYCRERILDLQVHMRM